MSGYKRFAVAGAGTLGTFMVDELLKQKSTGRVGRVVVLTRSVEGHESLSSKGAEPITVDYTSPSSLQSALQGIDVVISTLGIPALAVQEPLGDAARAAGVKLFVPSEFGNDSLKVTTGPFAVKNVQREKLERIGLPWAVFITGPFADWTFYQSIVGLDVSTGKVEVGGTGNGMASWTSRRDIARFVVHVTLSLSPERLHNHLFRVEGERTSINRILAEYQRRTGKQLEITYTPLDKVEEAARNPADIKAFLQLTFEKHGTYGTEEEMNVDWPEFNPETVVDSMLNT